MIRMQITLPEEMANQLKAVANQDGISVSELIRRAIDRYLSRSSSIVSDEKREKALSVIGIGNSGLDDLGTNHNEYLTLTCSLGLSA
jgi:metal-responsive CopG/Arc/MetJ family transcriptional regulator